MQTAENAHIETSSVGGKNGKMQKRVIGYCRVSTRMQADEGISIDAQQETIKKWCDLTNAKLVKIFTDVESGAKEERQGLADALSYIESDKADSLVVLKFDRLSRSVLHFCKMYERYFESTGKDLHSIQDGINLASSIGRMVVTILISFAQMERETIGERVSVAVKWKAEHGYHTGKVPYGFRAVPAPDGSRFKVLAPEPKEQEVLARIKSMIESGDRIGEIATALTRDKVEPPQGEVWTKNLIYNLKRRKNWHKARPVNTERWHSDEEMKQRALELQSSGLIPRQIANRLNAEGYKPYKGSEFTENGVRKIILRPSTQTANHPRKYLQGLFEQWAQAHAVMNPGKPYQRPGTPKLAEILTSQGFKTPTGKTEWFPAQVQRLLRGEFDCYYDAGRQQRRK